MRSFRINEGVDMEKGEGGSGEQEVQYRTGQLKRLEERESTTDSVLCA